MPKFLGFFELNTKRTMKKIIKNGFLWAIIFVFAFSVGLASACEDEPNSTVESAVESIALEVAGGNMIKWTVDGTSAKGFKVVWSKNENPTYPTREGDKYHYYSDCNKKSDTLTAFSGAGTYYVRVCEYLGGACGVYSNQITVTVGGSSEEEETVNISSITLVGEGNRVEWEIDGTSPKGFKVVWSKSENPTYPARSTDRYHYYSDPGRRGDTLTAFDGGGIYYVRVCEYLGGACGVYSNQKRINIIAAEEICDECDETTEGGVESITLTGERNSVKWTVDGHSTRGFKIVWSKNENPTYPTRSGDKYHYRSGSHVRSDFITPFAGDGVYYVRVCEYLGGKCGVYSNEIDVELINAKDEGVKQIEEIRDSAKNLYENKLDLLLAEINELRNLIKEQQVIINHLTRLKAGLFQAISAAIEDAIKNFITYGVDDNTKSLGEGERAAVIYSFKAAFGKLPETEEELEEAIKIANGRWPSITNNEAEAKAKSQFKKIYLRDPDMNDPHDAAAIKVMAYGLRQRAKNRNLNSERAGLRIFRAIFGYLPDSTEDWNALQAITYSGATR